MARILIVDDEEHIRRFYTEELSEEGHEVFTVASGHNLLRRIDSLRNRFYDLPVVLCTAYDTYKYDEKATAADSYVIKSFDLSELKTAIQKAIEADTSIPLTL
jgi:two-component system response regulator (stage 0 sporulation protein F)